MKIEIRMARSGWTWAIVAKNGKQTANNEVFASRSNAIRAAKAVVAGIVRKVSPQTRLVWLTSIDGPTIARLTFSAKDLQ